MPDTRRSFLHATAAGAAAAGLLAGTNASGLARSLLGSFSRRQTAGLAGAAAGPVLLHQGPAVRDPYAGAADLSWWKGQLHTHTSRSFDGDPNVPPARRAAQY